MILDKLFQLMAEKQASDIFISAGMPIHIKIQGNTVPVNQQLMDPAMIEKIAFELMSPDQIRTFEATMEMNLSFGVPNVGNFRINLFRQRITGARQFERLLSKQTDEDQLFGRIDLSSLIPGSVPDAVLQDDEVHKNLRFDLHRSHIQIRAGQGTLSRRRQNAI